mmetsp:Transcript_7396/g.20735  ORF Transcript_7396/g.20735 Transcript_7396/m.20735 type:complete len:329 (-) Transcript_7396:550-1536(-)
MERGLCQLDHIHPAGPLDLLPHVVIPIAQLAQDVAGFCLQARDRVGVHRLHDELDPVLVRDLVHVGEWAAVHVVEGVDGVLLDARDRGVLPHRGQHRLDAAGLRDRLHGLVRAGHVVQREARVLLQGPVRGEGPHGLHDGVDAAALRDALPGVHIEGQVSQRHAAVLLHCLGRGVRAHGADDLVDATGVYDLRPVLRDHGQLLRCPAGPLLQSCGLGVLNHGLGYRLHALASPDLLLSLFGAQRKVAQGSASMLLYTGIKALPPHGLQDHFDAAERDDLLLAGRPQCQLLQAAARGLLQARVRGVCLHSANQRLDFVLLHTLVGPSPR